MEWSLGREWLTVTTDVRKFHIRVAEIVYIIETLGSEDHARVTTVFILKDETEIRIDGALGGELEKVLFQ